MKKGYVLTMDAIVALVLATLVFVAVLGMHESLRSTEKTGFKKIHYTSEDAIEVLNKKGVLDQVCTDWAMADNNKTSPNWIAAESTAKQHLSQIIPERMGYRLLIDGVEICNDSRVPEEVASAKTHSTRILSGYLPGMPPRAYVARAGLSNIRGKKASTYVYFGGYEGDGNITKKITLPGDANVTGAFIELNAGSDFDLYVNDKSCRGFSVTGANMSVNANGSIDITNPNCNFKPGSNTIEIKFSQAENCYIGGGYVRVEYKTSKFDTTHGLDTYKFPGIKGIINLYSSFYVPGVLNSMEAYIHYDNNLSNATIYLTITNKTLFRSNVNGEQHVVLTTNNFTDVGLDYSEISKKTVPIRLGTEAPAISSNLLGIADIIFVIDSTGSMCGEIGIVHSTASDFADILANKSIDFRLGIMEHKDWPGGGCGGGTDFPYLWRGFTSDVTTFKTEVSSIGCGGGADIPESYLDALNQTRSVPWRSNATRINIMMGDAMPHDSDCGTSRACAGVLDSMTDEVILWLADDNITTHVINYAGMCKMEDIATGTGGTFYDYSVASDIEDILLEIANLITNVSYMDEQTIVITENITLNNTLYPDSYIRLHYSPTAAALEYGEVSLTFESPAFGNNITTGKFNVPNGTRPIDAIITSYSAAYWTDRLNVSNASTMGWKEVYRLSEYGDSYISLGDPYTVHIPADYMAAGDNYVSIATGASLTNYTGGSPDNKAIYTVAIGTSVGYGEPKSEREGCNWLVEFPDGSTNVIKIPSNYIGVENCNYTSASIAYNNRDVISDAAYRLFKQLDIYPEDGRLDISFNPGHIKADTSTVGGVRSLWGPVVVKLVVWMR